MPYGVEARVLDRGRLVVEMFERGALAGADPARVPLTATHPRDAGTLPIGVTVELRDERRRACMAPGESRPPRSATRSWPWPATASRSGCRSGSSRSPAGSRWSADRRRVTRTRAALDHVAVVRVPAYAGAAVQGVRAAHGPALAYPLANLARRHG